MSWINEQPVLAEWRVINVFRIWEKNNIARDASVFGFSYCQVPNNGAGGGALNNFGVFFSLFAYHLQTTQNLQDYTTGSMGIHSNPMAITNNK